MATALTVIGAFLAAAGVFAATHHWQGALAVFCGVLISRSRD